MQVALLNPQGNFDPADSGWTQHPDFGGQLVYVKEVALALGELGQQVDIVTRRINDPDWPGFAGFQDSYPGHGRVRILRFSCGPAHFLPKEELWPYLTEWVGGILAHYRGEGRFPDVIAGHYGDGGLAAALIRRRRGLPYTFTAHSLGAQKMDKTIGEREEFERVVERFHFDRRIAAERVAMAGAGRIVASTRQERFEQYGHRLYGGAVDPWDEGRFAVIPPGVNLRIFGRDRPGSADRRVSERVARMLERDIPGERRGLPVVICSSRLDSKKNHVGLLKAWAVSRALRQAANLAIVTRGVSDPLRQWPGAFRGEERRVFQELMGQVTAHGLEECVTAFDLNSQEELASCFRYLSHEKRGIFALTSLYEPFGLAPLEAMAAGLPAVVTRNGGPGESLRDDQGEYGVLVDPQDPEDVARGLLSLASNPERWRDLQAKARRRVLESYTWQRTALGYLEQFESVLGMEGGSRKSFPIPAFLTKHGEQDSGHDWLRKLYYGKKRSSRRNSGG